MARLPRKFVGVTILLIILINIWILSKKHLPRNFELSPDADPSEEVSGTSPNFSSHKQGDSWNQGSADKPVKNNGQQQQQIPTVNGKQGPLDGSSDSSKSSGKKDGASQYSGDDLKAPKAFSQKIPKNYEAAMKDIKRILNKFVQIPPGISSLTGEHRYFRGIKLDSDKMDNGELPPTSSILGMYLKVADDEVETLKRTHAEMMSLLPDSIMESSSSGRGIVMTGGGKYFPMVLTAIRWLREQDKDTPIEVFMADASEYEPHICDRLFPTINVECRVLRDIYGGELSDKLDSKYALKPLAILASKFDDIYFMDADSYPLLDISRVFDWKIYQETGLILNADYWPRYISPRFYEVAGINLGGRVRGNPESDALLQSDRENAVPGRSTESGQVFVRKSSHIKSLLLAMYYNLYGPDVYFPLLMQDGHGEGDKDTYAAAAIICGESYYQTQRRPVTLGQHRPEGFHGYAMVQPDPITDYEIHENNRLDMTERFFALHANSIKSNAKYLLQSYNEPMRGAPPLRQNRLFGDMNNVRNELLEDEDVEYRLFRVMKDVTCDWVVNEGYQPRDWDEEDTTRLCRILQRHTEWLKANPDVGYPEDAAYWIDLEA